MTYVLDQQPKRDILDFSANINPLGPPTHTQEKWNACYHEVDVYPEPSYRQARQQIASKESLDSEQVLLTNGGAEAIYLVAHMMRGKKALIVHPTFSEYEHACHQHNVQVESLFFSGDTYDQLEMHEMLRKLPHVDLIFLGRPNNPTGHMLARHSLLMILNEAQKEHTYVVIDEAFIDFVEDAAEQRMSAYINMYSYLIVLRSMTKMYAIPGLRLGYILAQRHIIEQLRAGQIAWSVNGPAAHLVQHLLQQDSFVHQTRQWLIEEKRFLDDHLRLLNFRMSISTCNFYLLFDDERPGDVAPWFTFLLERGIMARHTVNFTGLAGTCLRLAVRTRMEHEKLVGVLKLWRNQS